MSRPFLAAFALAAVALPAAAQAPVRQPEPGPAQAQRVDWEGKVDRRLLDLSAGDRQDFLIVLSQRPEAPDRRQGVSKQERGQAVVERLRDNARRSQGPLVEWLRARGVDHEAFWIANMIHVRGPRSLIEEVARRSDVERIEANSRTRRSVPPPASADSGARRRPAATRAVAQTHWNLELVRAPEVWASGVTGQGVVIGIGDTGVEWDHPALKPRYRGWNGSAANHSYNWHDAIHDAGAGNLCGSDASAPCDDDIFGHGTRGLGVAVGDDGAGNRVGVAPGARWIGCRNMDEGAGTPARYAECFQWFVAPTDSNGSNPRPDLAPDIITNSWDCPPTEGCSTPDVLKTVIQNVRAAGILVVVAAGNDGGTCGTIVVPGIYEEVLTVGACDIEDDLAFDSSRGPGQAGVKPDVIAPGDPVLTSDVGGDYNMHDGTSAATPHVAGLAALVLSASPGLSGQVETLEDIVRGTSVPKTTGETCGGLPAGSVPNNSAGWGRIDAVAARDAALCPPPAPSIDVPLSVPPATAGLTASVPPSPAHSYSWTLQGGALTGGNGGSAVSFTSGAAGTRMSLSVVDSIVGCASPAGVEQIQVDFDDVPPSHLFHSPIVSVALAGISTGCGGGDFCPAAAVTRAQMAVFILRAVHGANYQPPAPTGTLFVDVPLGTFLGNWIEDFSRKGYTTGCGGGNYCPNLPLNRAAAAVFLLRGIHAPSYTPPPPTGTVFDDVPPGAFLGSWIERLNAEGITGGCGGGNFCPSNPVTRGEMAAFLTRAFPP